MENFDNRGSRRNSRGEGNDRRSSYRKNNFGGDRGGRRDDRGTMFKAVCNECHKDCEVPFRPSSDKPIYCDSCFKNKRGNESPRREFGDRRGRGDKRDFSNRPNFQRPQGGQSQDEIKKQLSELNNKLDRLISSIEKLSATKTLNPEVVLPKEVKTSSKVEKKKGKKTTISKNVVKKIPAKKVTSKKK